LNSNQHYVSQVLLRRFAVKRQLQLYDIANDSWEPKSTKDVFSSPGYNQLLVDGLLDDNLEQGFQKVESQLRDTLKALKEAWKAKSTKLPAKVFENLCWYFAFLKGVSPVTKAVAAVNFVLQLNGDLERGDNTLLRDVLKLPLNAIEFFKAEVARGNRIIIESSDFQQFVYRLQFVQQYGYDYKMFRHSAKWLVARSPIELPVPDVGVVPLGMKDAGVNIFLLPIGPRLLVRALIKHGKPDNSDDTVVTGAEFNQQEAEYCLDVLCASAVRNLVSASVIQDVPGIRARAKTKGITFARLVEPERVYHVGQKNFTAPFGLISVSQAHYVKFVHSYIQPGAR
jgi:hypothetical protein